MFGRCVLVYFEVVFLVFRVCVLIMSFEVLFFSQKKKNVLTVLSSPLCYLFVESLLFLSFFVFLL